MQSSTTLKDKKGDHRSPCSGAARQAWPSGHKWIILSSPFAQLPRGASDKTFFFFLKMISSTAPNPSQHLELLQENSSGLRDQKFLFPKFKMKTELQVAPGQTQVGDRGC